MDFAAHLLAHAGRTGCAAIPSPPAESLLFVGLDPGFEVADIKETRRTITAKHQSPTRSSAMSHIHIETCLSSDLAAVLANRGLVPSIPVIIRTEEQT
jgi:hypothetical protein